MRPRQQTQNQLCKSQSPTTRLVLQNLLIFYPLTKKKKSVVLNLSNEQIASKWERLRSIYSFKFPLKNPQLTFSYNITGKLFSTCRSSPIQLCHCRYVTNSSLLFYFSLFSFLFFSYPLPSHNNNNNNNLKK